jgi:hypothetical protein
MMDSYGNQKISHEKGPNDATFGTARFDDDDRPPPYEAHSRPAAGPSQAIPANPSPPIRPSRLPTLPCVIPRKISKSQSTLHQATPNNNTPETHKAFGSPFESPFTRAYPPSLSAHGISQSDFLAFIDGLNEVFISHPVLKGVNTAGALMGQCYGLSSVQYAGMGLQLASKISSAAASYLRTKVYFKACNEGIFHPVGLHAAVLTTGDMMVKVGRTERWLRLPPLETCEDLEESMIAEREGSVKTAHLTVSSMEDPRMRRLDALRGYVAPLDFNVPAVVAPDSLINKMAAWQAQKTTEKQEKKDLKRREKARAKAQRPEEKGTKGERRLEKKLASAEKSLEKNGGDPHGKKVRRAQERYEREQRKVERKVGRKEERSGKYEKREEEKANKIRWIVITRWEDQAECDVDSDGEDVETGTDVNFSNLHDSR